VLISWNSSGKRASSFGAGDNIDVWDSVPKKRKMETVRNLGLNIQGMNDAG
jgi:hypothetical protein